MMSQDVAKDKNGRWKTQKKNTEEKGNQSRNNY